jgi:hypothetical protein
MREYVYTGDVGVDIILTVTSPSGEVMDLSSATEKTLHLNRPGANGHFDKPLSFITDGTDGKVKYTTETGVLDTAGMWHVQGYFEFPGDKKWHTGIAQFHVYLPLPEEN